MIIQISDDDSIILKNLIWNNYHGGKHKTVDLQLHLENGHLYILLNNGGILKIKRYKHGGKPSREARKASFKRKPKEYEGICIDLNILKEKKREE